MSTILSIDEANALAAEHFTLATAFAKKNAHHHLGHDEVESIAMESLVKSSRTYDASRGPFRPFAWAQMEFALSAAARNQNRQKRGGGKAARQFAVDDDGREIEIADDADSDESNSHRDDLQRVLPKLPREIQEILQDRFFAGKSVAEIAADRGVSERTVNNRIADGLQKCKTLLADPVCDEPTTQIRCVRCGRSKARRAAEVVNKNRNGIRHFYCSNKCHLESMYERRGVTAWDSRATEILRKNFHKMSYTALANLIGRDRWSVVSKATRLGLRKFKLWTKRDEKFLRDNYERMTVKQLSVALSRSISSVRGRIASMGLKKSHCPSAPRICAGHAQTERGSG